MLFYSHMHMIKMPEEFDHHHQGTTKEALKTLACKNPGTTGHKIQESGCTQPPKTPQKPSTRVIPKRPQTPV